MSADMKSKVKAKEIPPGFSQDMKSKVKVKEIPPGFSQDIIKMGLQENCLEEIKICLFGFDFFADVKENLFFFFNRNFVNHSCSPNASLLVFNSSSEVTAELRAIKDIYFQRRRGHILFPFSISECEEQISNLKEG